MATADIIGRQFGDLTVLRRVENDRVGKVCWLCRCSCGNELTVQALQLKSGRTWSCGCGNRTRSRKMHGHMHYRDDTCLEVLRRSCRDKGRNRSGFRGQFLLPNSKYRASITFRGKHCNLGHYPSFDRAVQPDWTRKRPCARGT